MKHQGYFTRALKANDPRYARVFGKLGYDTSAMQAADAPARSDEDLTAVRQRYQDVVGKKPFHGWSVDELNQKIADHEAGKD